MREKIKNAMLYSMVMLGGAPFHTPFSAAPQIHAYISVSTKDSYAPIVPGRSGDPRRGPVNASQMSAANCAARSFP